MMVNKLFTILISSSLLLGESSFVGVVKPKHNINLSFTTDGVVNKILIKEGSVVKEDKALIVLKNSLQKLETQRRKLIWQDKSKLNSNLSEEKVLSSLYHSTKKLYQDSGGVSKSELQSLQIKYLAAIGETKYLKENEKREKIEYEIAKNVLGQYTLRSPINGIVTRINTDLGEFVKNTEPILSIVDSSTCYVEMNVDKKELSKISLNQILDISSKIGNKLASKKAKIIFISPIADRSSGLFSVKAQFNNEDLEIPPGLTVQVNLPKS